LGRISRIGDRHENDAPSLEKFRVFEGFLPEPCRIPAFRLHGAHDERLYIPGLHRHKPFPRSGLGCHEKLFVASQEVHPREGENKNRIGKVGPDDSAHLIVEACPEQGESARISEIFSFHPHPPTP